MRTIFETTKPRDEVLSGELREATFAARLADVVAGRAHPVYGDPKIFFSRTYPTEGLKTLLKEVLGRLYGTDPMTSPVLRLETGFGGGKTHNLIALYHAASGKTPPNILEPYLQDDPTLPAKQPAGVAVIVGDDLNPMDGIRHDDGVITYTPWGEIAYQLGGPEAYNMVQESDLARVPGSPPWREIFQDRPILILIDELAPYLRTLKMWKGREALAGHVAPFLKSLLEAVASSPRAVCVLTLAESADAFGEENEELASLLTQLLAELRAISGRMERILAPTAGEEEIARILVRRLFEDVDMSAAKEIADAYSAYFEKMQSQGVELPWVSPSEFAALIKKSYPFHPELLVTLNRKVSTIPNFQRTRGALRLLALVIRRLWQTKPSLVWLIHPHHVDLSFEPMVEDLTSRLDRPRYKEVIHADITSPVPERPGFASDIDRRWQEQGRKPFAVRVATTILLHSLTQGPGLGARREEINAACLAPGDDPSLLKQALEEMDRRCWYLEYEGDRWRFQTEPSPNKMIVDEMQYVGVAKAKQILDERLAAIWQSGIFEVRRFPAEPADIPDDAGKPKLAIMHYDAAAVTGDEVPPLVRRLYEEKGTSGEPRTFRNNVLFLVCSETQKDKMIEAVRYAEAVRRLADNPERRAHLTREQRLRLRERRNESDLQLRIAIHRAYRVLFYPAADAPMSSGGLARELLPPQDQGDIRRDQSQVILEALKRLEKVYTSDDPPIAPELIKRLAWPHGAREVMVSDVVRAFAMRRGLRMLLDHRPLREGLIQGVKRGLWIYYDPAEGKGYGKDSPPPLVRINGEAVLLDPELAQERGIAIVGSAPEVERCPVCGEPADRCRCQVPPPPLPSGILEASGTIEQALQNIVDQMSDRGTWTVSVLRIALEGDDVEGVRELRGLGLGVPQLGPGQHRMHVTATGEFANDDFVKLEFKGPWERYRELKDVLISMLERAGRCHVRAELECRHPDGLSAEALAQIRDIFRHLELGRVRVTAEPKEES